MARRWMATLIIALTGGGLFTGCLYRVPPPPVAETPTAVQTGAAPAVLAAPTAAPTPPPTVSPTVSPTASPTELAAPTAAGMMTPEVLLSPTAEIPAARESPVPEASPTPQIEPSPLPTLVPIAPVTHRFTLGESLWGVVGIFLSQRLKRMVTEDEVRVAVRTLLEDPANAHLRDRPALVYPGQVVTLTPLITQTESLTPASGAR
jgi:hypothetical protein